MSRRSRPHGVSLRFELGTLQHAVAGARLLGDLAHRGDAPTAHDAQLAGEAASAVLGLVALRLQALDCVLAGDTDATAIAAPHNVVDGDLDDDILLPLTRGRQ